MRILDLTAIYPSQAIDFEGRSVASLNRAWADAGLQVTTLVLRQWLPYWVARRIPAYHHLAVLDGITDEKGVKVVCSHYPHLPHVPKLPERFRTSLNINLMAKRALKLCRQLNLAGDLIHAEGIIVGLAGAVVAKRLGLPLFITLRDDLGHLISSPEQVSEPIYQRLFSQTAAFFCIGPAQMHDLPQLLPATNPPESVLAPNGIDIQKLQSQIAQFPPHRAEFSGRIVSVSNLHARWKGIHENLWAMRKLIERGIADWHYTIVGDGRYRPELEQMVQELGLGGHVTFAGGLPHIEALRKIYDADIFCLPSFMEAFGNVFAEAALCERPAIGCRDNGPEMIIKEGETGLLVAPRNVEELADALAYLLAHPEEAQRMGKAAAQHIQQFTWARTAQIYKDTFQELASGPRLSMTVANLSGALHG